jgi:hypothetical protein
MRARYTSTHPARDSAGEIQRDIRIVRMVISGKTVFQA